MISNSYYGIVQLIPILQYSNVYSTTPALQRLMDDPQSQFDCIKYVAKSGKFYIPRVPRCAFITQFF